MAGAKRKRVAPIVSRDNDEVIFAARMAVRSAGNTAGAKLIEEVLTSPTRAREFLDVWNNNKDGVKSFTEEEALALSVDMTKSE